MCILVADKYSIELWTNERRKNMREGKKEENTQLMTIDRKEDLFAMSQEKL